MAGDGAHEAGGMASVAESVKEDGKGQLLAVIRLRGSGRISGEFRRALERLRLRRVNNCVLMNGSDTTWGMLHHTEDFVTWGQVSEKSLGILLEKRGRGKSGSRIDGKQAKSIAKRLMKEGTAALSDVNPVFRLTPPSGGIRSVRLHHPRGDLGDRGEKINDLIMRMV